MTRNISKFILRLFGWKYIGEIPENKKAVILAAPHTSNWDFIWGKLCLVSIGIPTAILMKKEMFIFPFSYLLKYWGVIPVNRSRKSNLVDTMAEEFNSRQELYIVLSPEGTRKANSEWKKGFYYIAHKAQVPLFLAKIDYKNKTLEAGETYYTSGDYDNDIKYIKSYYKDSNPKYPNFFKL
ncbi:MAG: 1-acyl-sn-glycerol-3-phosphate acyltransferase [Marinifilaceae bacterium]|jgi:1-acyl-sn-glycerol-3-phosphate acyltransferase|nr:1-acyl-sn-glycerol-3-phosphate acyltransferase [Marinifilaceae bacterium]